MTPTAIRALYERAFDADDEDVIAVIREVDRLRAQVDSLTAERDEARAAAEALGGSK